MATLPVVPPSSTNASSTDAGLAASGRRVFEIEGDALAAVASRIDGEFSAACRLMLAAKGRVV